MTRKTLKPESIFENRRKLLKAVGGSALLVSASGLAACSGGDSSTPAASTPAPAARSEPEAAPSSAPEPAEAAAPEPAPQPAPAAAQAPASGGMPQLNPSDPQAKGLGYVENAASIDAAAQPRFKPGQACSNCTLFLEQSGAEWGPCSIFPGKLVKAEGWCTVYSPKA